MTFCSTKLELSHRVKTDKIPNVERRGEYLSQADFKFVVESYMCASTQVGALFGQIPGFYWFGDLTSNIDFELKHVIGMD